MAARPSQLLHRQSALRITASALPDELRNKERYQPKLARTESNAWRKKSQQLGKALCTTTLGRGGITRNFVIALGDALAKNELVKVKVGGNCSLDMDEVRDALTEATDSVQVHNIGFTLTLYRDKSLPRPLSSLPNNADTLPQYAEQLTAQEIAQQERRKRVRQYRAAERDVIAARPPAFDVIAPPSRQQPDARSGDSAAEPGKQRQASARLGICAVALAMALSSPGQPAAADQLHLPLMAGNAAVLQGIQRLNEGESSEGGPQPSTEQRQASKLQQIQQQLRRIKTLVGIGQYDSARLQLREGPSAGLRKTLQQAEQDFTSVSDKDVKAAKASFETLDGALKQRQSSEQVGALAQSASDNIGVVISDLRAAEQADAAAALPAAGS